MSDAQDSRAGDNGRTGNLFLQMVLTLQTSAMQHLGKIASPFTGNVERDLLSAKTAIDMLVMLQDKTRGNLNETEVKILNHVVYELQMNYVDEAKKPEPPPEPSSPESDAEKPDEEPTAESRQPRADSKPDPTEEEGSRES
jgi:hypothetical protein